MAVNERTSLNELYSFISLELSNKLPSLDIKKPIYRDFRIGDVLHSLADISKAQKLLDYKPTYYIADGLKETIDWFIEQS